MSKVRYKIGEAEFEVEGEESFVAAQREKFLELLVQIGVLESKNNCVNTLSPDVVESETPVPEKKKGTESKRKKIDYGKIMALRNAGWDNEKIADEMHMTKASVATAISTYKKKYAGVRHAVFNLRKKIKKSEEQGTGVWTCML